MPDRERIMQVVGEWTAKAENDLKTATHTLLMPKNVRPNLSVSEQRYPGYFEEISLTEARRAVALARRVRNEIGKHLPKVKKKRGE